MALAAQLYRDARAAERFSVELDATLRDPSHLPLDVMIEDLSASGFRVLTTADLAVGAEIGLGLAGIGAHRARIVWQADGVYGCAFVEPLSSAALATALSAPSTAPVALPRVGPWGPVSADADSSPARKLPVPVRLLVIAVLSVMAWAVVVAIGLIVVRGALF